MALLAESSSLPEEDTVTADNAGLAESEEKLPDEQAAVEDTAFDEDSEPACNKKRRSGENDHIPAPKTPPIREKATLDPQSPWAKQKVSIPVRGGSADKKRTTIQSKPQRGAVAVRGGEFREYKPVDAIWNCMMVAQTTCVLVLGWQEEPTGSSYNGALGFFAWGLSSTNEWV